MRLEMNADRTWRPNVESPSFTRIELMVVLAVIALLACLLLLAMRSARQRAYRISCTCNLKQIGLSFKTWSLDNQGRFPWQVLTNQPAKIKPEAAASVSLQFLMMSNELSTPNILRCPADAQRVVAPNFANLNNTNISYFIGLDAQDSTPNMFLNGDRNLTNGLAVTNRVLFLAANLPLGWTHELHSFNGNIGLADGSVQQFSPLGLMETVTNNAAGNRLLMP